MDLQIQRLSALDSDFAPFVQHAGVPSIDMYYGRGTPSYFPYFWIDKFLGQNLRAYQIV